MPYRALFSVSCGQPLILAVDSLRLISVLVAGPFLVQIVARRLTRPEGGTPEQEFCIGELSKRKRPNHVVSGQNHNPLIVNNMRINCGHLQLFSS